eukprot:5338651-Pyramimonas_sp.AAC.1
MTAQSSYFFDIRGSDAFFNAPLYSQLPTASAWSSVSLPDQCGLPSCQADVDRCFYRIGLPAGISGHFAPSCLLSPHWATLPGQLWGVSRSRRVIARPPRASDGAVL